MTAEQFRTRKRRTYSVLDLISERLGSAAAADWARECTPLPFGLPSDEQLADGVKLAAGDVTLKELIMKTHSAAEELAG